ncbi:hypothetical protein Q7P37_009473 [Cladosporium fusiforme]
MICGVCYGMLRGHRGRRWRRTYELHFDHQANWIAIRQSATAGCCFCKVLAEVLEGSDLGTAGQIDASATTQAFLSEVPNRPALYRLDFRLGEARPLATFFLEQLSDGSAAQVYTPSTEHTSSQEVLQLARSWITTCTGPEHAVCPNDTFDDHSRSSARYYPTRLIQLPPYHSKPYAEEDIANTRVRLVNTNGWPVQSLQSGGSHSTTGPKSPYDSPTVQSEGFGLPFQLPGQYVTLSHCWGQSSFMKLTKENRLDFEAGIELSALPKTFQQAIDFASRLRKDIKYIWIDALCIIQNSDEDWKTESVKMYDVYRNSFCNISATHAKDNTMGLYHERNPQHLWEDEVRLNTEGIPTAFPNKSLLGAEPLLRRCGIWDATSWNRLIENAPVNQRAWVLQERLLAPRVLHFGRDHISWECRLLEATENLPYGSSSDLQVKDGILLEKTRLKSSLPQDHGPRSLVPDPDTVAWQAHECWKRIIERYATTAITKESDRLIALAGIAQMISRQIGSRVVYVAGLWEKWLASQLLWRVNSYWSDGTYSFPQRRARSYVAPSFSWASILAEQGVKCGETIREDRLLFSVKHISLPEKTDRDRFSVFESDESMTFIELAGWLTGIKIVKGRGGSTTRYRWNLMNSGRTSKWDLSGLYLDSPGDDSLSLRQPQCRVPLASPCHYKRMGLAMVPAYEATQLALERDISAEPSSPSHEVNGGWRKVRIRLY